MNTADFNEGGLVFTLAPLFFFILGSVLLYMCCWFLIGLILRRNDVADIAWGLGFIFVAILCIFISQSSTATVGIHQYIILVLVSIWGGRLALHIFLRNRNKPEDRRYAEWRQSWGKWFFLRSFFQVYMLQGVLLVCVSMSTIAAIQEPHQPLLQPIEAVGIMIWIIGFLFEFIGDAQLAAFLKNPQNKGKVMTSGLWKYTRHPNYFGEATMWWGIFFLVAWMPIGFVAIISPLTITFLLTCVSGVPLAEKRRAGDPAFEAYKRKTSVFIPWFPKKETVVQKEHV